MWNLLAPMVGPIVDKLVDRIPNSNERKRAKEEFENCFLLMMNTSLCNGI